MPAAYCEMTVAAAAPPTPHISTLIKNKSRTIFSTAENPRKQSGISELPSARIKFAAKLYRNVAAIPANINKRYSFINGATSPGTRRNARMP